MTKRILVVVAVAVLMCFASTAYAAGVGLIPKALGTEGNPKKATSRGTDLSGGVPSNIAGLAGYALFGEGAGAAAAVTYSHTFRRVPVRSRVLELRYGLLGGVSVAGEEVEPLIGGYIEAEVENLAGLVLVVRPDSGVVVNPGVKVNLVGWTF